jgi:hypothetical protein
MKRALGSLVAATLVLLVCVGAMGGEQARPAADDDA